MKKLKKRQQYSEENAIEAKANTSVDSTSASEIAGDFWEQVLGIKNSEQTQRASGELEEGKELDLTGKEKKAENIEAGL